MKAVCPGLSFDLASSNLTLIFPFCRATVVGGTKSTAACDSITFTLHVAAQHSVSSVHQSLHDYPRNVSVRMRAHEYSRD